MSRRRQSPAEDVIDLTSSFPWWVGLLLATISYFILHHYSDLTFKGSVAPSQFGDAVVSQLFRTLAYFGQFVLPALFTIGAMVSWIRRRRRKKLYDSMEVSSIAETIEKNSSISKDPLKNMSWSDFEQLIAEFFQRNGFSVSETPSGPDGGVDLLLEKNGKKFIVQCKHWQKFKVSVQVVREQFGIMHAEGAHGVYIVTSGVFTEDAIQFAQGKNIVLIDGSKLRQIVSKTHRTIENEAETQISISTPFCPFCGSKMTRRTAKQGMNRGKDFWGCSRYPKCKGTLPA